MAPQEQEGGGVIPSGDVSYAQGLLLQKRSTDSEPEAIKSAISTLGLLEHIEGGYFVETDRDERVVPNPFENLPSLANATSRDESTTRNASTTIYYLLGQASPVGYFHRNRGRTVHTLHRGRGRYVILHFDRKVDGKVPVETFVVGPNIEAGEKLQWIVEGGKFKSSFLLPDDDDQSSGGLLISETVVPGFDYADHDFMTAEGMAELASQQIDELKWLLKRGEQDRLEGVLAAKR
jgi:predicted cupin superfamily sugar epimerase